MEKFRTQINVIGNNRTFCPTGEKIEYRHRADMKENGRRELIKDKAVAIYDLIQSHREECEIENIIRRAVEGDYTALNASNPLYTDITNCPSSIAEAQQFIINAKEDFDKLPKEIKAKFEFNPELYIAEMSHDTEGWLEKVGIADKIKAKKEEEYKAAVTLENYQKVMSQLAQGETIINTNTEEEKSNE